MRAIATIVAALLLALSAAEASFAQTASRHGYEATTSATPKRARTRVYVRPLYPYRSYHSLYPPPYDVEYPGPNAHRECAGGLATEHRASGTVVVPRLNCWWAPGRYAGP